MATEHKAFDPHRPPDPDLIDDCVHCGFCLPTCPTYVLWGEEMDSPRGRIVLMNAGHEEPMSDAMVRHWDRCLGCMACVTACPSGVQYDKLIEQTRPQVERNHRRTLRERALRRALFETFTHPGRLRALVPLLAASQRLGLTRLASSAGDGDGRFARVRAMTSLAPEVRLRDSYSQIPEVVPAQGRRRGRVGLLLGCVQRVFLSDVNAATARVLAAEGYEVFAPRRIRCCGALMFHTGYEQEALELAKKMIEAFEDCDAIAVNAAGCGSSMKDYGHVLADDPQWGERARAFSDKVQDVTELLASEEAVAPRFPVPLRLAYHDACHLAHAQGVRSQPRALLGAIPELEVIEPDEWEICCGSAGIYNLLQPTAADELGARKARNLVETGAEAIAAGNPGCTLQISAHLEKMNKPLPVYHPMEILDTSIGNRRLSHA